LRLAQAPLIEVHRKVTEFPLTGSVNWRCRRWCRHSPMHRGDCNGFALCRFRSTIELGLIAGSGPQVA
jgi:hypothetical protein